jgi:hypothetical protein
MRVRLQVVAVLLAIGVQALAAHHSFAVFFDDAKIMEIKGVVTEFRFTNPHGLISLDVKTPQGVTEAWRVETNAPTLLRRRGWTNASIKVGEVVSVEGWPSRDGAKFLRMRRVTRADGTVLGTPVVNANVPREGTGEQK